MTLVERVLEISDMSEDEAGHLGALTTSWQVLADLSFSDLVLYVRVAGAESFEICAQIRPLTSQTLYPEDLLGRRFGQPEQPIVERAFREGRIWAQADPVYIDGTPIRMDAVPVRCGGRIVGVVAKEGSPAISRRPGQLEEVYLEAAEIVSEMVCQGTFPFPGAPVLEWLRVGEGLCLLDPQGQITWASPNALSSLHRLGPRHNLLGSTLGELAEGGQRTVTRAMLARSLSDGELVSGEAHVRVRVLPLVKVDDIAGALVLVRDVTELRQKERLLSVKDATIREIHHRVKNNLQTIASLLRLQGRRVGSHEAKIALQESTLRIGSIALVHETLSEGPSDVTDFGEVARRIVPMVAEGLLSPEMNIDFQISGSTGPLGAEVATPLAVILTELLQNAVQHGFPHGREGRVNIDLGREKGYASVIVRDDGVGVVPAHDGRTRLGLLIVHTLIEELEGRFELVPDGGTRACVNVPVDP